MLGYSNVGIPDKSWQPPVAVLETTMGTIIVEMYWKHSPNTCRNFMELVRRGYYNNTKFHRVIRDFMIQGGDPTGTGKGGQSIYGPTFDDEITNDLKHTGAGILSMANAGPCTNGSQFFITLAPTQWLDGKHTIFGRVQGGMPVVKRIGLVECDKNDCPVDDVKIERAILQCLYDVECEDNENNIYYDMDATHNEQETWNSGLNADNSVIVITNPSEARLPADTISVKILRETMEARAKAARSTPSTTKLS